MEIRQPFSEIDFGTVTSISAGSGITLTPNPITTTGTIINNLLVGISGGQTAIGGTAITDILKLQGTTGNGTLTSPAIQLLTGNNGATTAMTILNNGNVGIDTTSPNQQLEITNSFAFPQTTSSTIGVIYKGANPFIHDYKSTNATGLNTFVGQNSGNFTMHPSPDDAGHAYMASQNVGFGPNTLSSLTTGYNNMVLGFTAGQKITSGGNNVAIGVGSMYAATTQSGGIHIGYYAGRYETASNKLIIDNTDRTDEATQRTSAIIYGVMSSTAANQILSLGGGGNVGIGTTSPNANALLDITSTTKAFMPPRMTTVQKAAIASPTASMIVFDSTLGKLCVYGNGGTWETITSI